MSCVLGSLLKGTTGEDICEASSLPTELTGHRCACRTPVCIRQEAFRFTIFPDWRVWKNAVLDFYTNTKFIFASCSMVNCTGSRFSASLRAKPEICSIWVRGGKIFNRDCHAFAVGTKITLKCCKAVTVSVEQRLDNQMLETINTQVCDLRVWLWYSQSDIFALIQAQLVRKI